MHAFKPFLNVSVAQSEDCLYLDLYKPKDGKDMPLVVVLNYFGQSAASRNSKLRWDNFGPEYLTTLCACVIAVVNIR